MDAEQQSTAMREIMQQEYEVGRITRLDMQSAFQNVGEIDSELPNGPEVLIPSRAQMRGPWGGSRKNLPCLNTALTTLGSARKPSGLSGSARTSPKSPLSPTLPLFPTDLWASIRSTKRENIWSTLSSDEEIEQLSIADFWRRQGGPPVPNPWSLAAPPYFYHANVSDQDNDDENDEEQADENVNNKYEEFSKLVDKYVPRLNPSMDFAAARAMTKYHLDQFAISDTLFPSHEPRPNPFSPLNGMHANSKNSMPAGSLGSAPLAFESNVGPNTVIPKRLQSDRAYCTECDDHPDGFRGDSELRRHRDRRHKVIVKKWICFQPCGPDHPEPVYPLSKCKACSQQRKRYNAYYNAAAHLRRVHFCPKRRVRGMSKSKVDGVNERDKKAARNWPAMSELKHWIVMMEVEEQTANLEGTCSGGDAEIFYNAVVEPDDEFVALSSWDRTYSFLYGSPISIEDDSAYRSSMPKLDRTMSDAYRDELYNPNLQFASAAPASTQVLAAAMPQNDVFAQRLQAANSQHLSANHRTPLAIPSRERSPFRQGSPLAPTSNAFGSRQQPNVMFGTASHMPVELLYPSSKREEPESVEVESVVPFTDSGYKSAPNVGYPPTVQANPKQSPCPLKKVPEMGGDEVEDRRTQYSIGSTVDPVNARKCIVDIASDIFGKLQLNGVGPENRTVFSQVLPNLIKAFAFKICDDRDSQENRDLMHFIHKRHREIGTQLEATFYLDNMDDPDQGRGHCEDMAVLDKMKMWNSKARQESAPLPTELFEGVEDEEEDPIDDSELTRYYTIIVQSPAYEWFINALAKESSLQFDTPQPRIRQRILDKLPTGKISKRSTPDIHQVTIDLEWRHSMEEMLRLEVLEELNSSIQSYSSPIIITGSQQAAQGLSIKQYLAQTWPITGLQLLYTLTTGIDIAPQSHVSYLGNTKVEIKLLPSGLSVTVTGPPYFVADVCELLAWTGSALLSSDRAARTLCLPLITNFHAETTVPVLPSLKHSFSCTIKFKLTETDASGHSLPRIQAFDREFLKRGPLVLGFPIRKRPEGYPGLELAFATVLHYLGTTKDRLLPPYACITGPTRRLLLIKHTDDIFLWKFDNLPTGYFSGCADYRINSDTENNHASIDYNVLVASRHIICEHAADDAPAKASRLIPEEVDLVSSRTCRPDFSAQANPAHDPQCNSDTENVPPIPYTDNLVPPELLSSSSGTLSTNCQPSPGTESSEASFDSDIFSISNYSENSEPIDLPSTVYPLIGEITRQLVTGFRTSTQYRSCPSSNGEKSIQAATTTTSGFSSTAARLCNKRKLSQDDEDGADEDGSSPLHPKKLKPGEAEKGQKYFACPYWKKDATKYRDCFKSWPARVQDVKFHLLRKHSIEFYCQRCHAKEFENKQGLQAHIINANCSPKLSVLDWISHEQRVELHKKSKRGTREVDQWFAIWDILFPGQQKPRSAYMDIGIVQRGCEYHHYSTIHGPAVIGRTIESSPAWQSLGMTEEERQESLRRAIAEGFNELYEEWRSETRGSESSSRSPDTQYESPANSLVDSAVVMAASASSEEAMSQRENISHSLPRNPVIDLSGRQVAGTHARSPGHPSGSAASIQHFQDPIFERQWLNWANRPMDAPGCDLDYDMNALDDALFDDVPPQIG